MSLRGMFGGWTIAGLILVILALIWVLAIFPMLSKLPSDLSETTNFEGTYTVMDPTTQMPEVIPVNVTRYYEATGTEDSVLILHQTVTTTHADYGIELPQFGLEETLGVDRTTREYVAGYGDMDRTGQFSAPSDLEQESYQLWNPTAMTDLEAKFVAEEEFEGLKVYAFQVDETGFDIGTQAGTGLPQVLDTTINLKVEPVTGTTVYSASITTIKIVMVPGMEMTVYESDIHFTDDTIADLVDKASSGRTMLLWGSVYGFWIVIGLGIALMLVGVVVNIRGRTE
ncbi:MAG TPA: DUF3068 domain-containing protein [Dehalococcoidia bacterium]|nr:DUF3068 domain-containing protein [Dehalococcoidia bacterium]